WYLKSAYNGNKIAQNNLGIYYYYDKGTYKNEKKAFERYMKSAIAGYAEGQCNLGFCYENGIGTIKDNKKAFEWYSR
ncbi:hypothetical protein RhiirA1_317942, partial [Rhizophagus irregularis]